MLFQLGEQAPSLAVAGQVIEGEIGGNRFQPAARRRAAAQVREVLVGPQEHVLRNILGMSVVSRQPGRGRENHVLISTHERHEFRRNGPRGLRLHWI